MRLKSSLSILMLCAALIAGCAGTAPSPPLNFGDNSVNSLWYQVDTRRRAGDQDQALIYADKLIELHAAEAREQQASLSDYPVGQKIYSYNTLNYIALTFLTRGDILEEQGNTPGAREAYNTVIRDFSYAQCCIEDNFYKVADEARERLNEQQ